MIFFFFFIFLENFSNFIQNFTLFNKFGTHAYLPRGVIYRAKAYTQFRAER